MGSEDKVVVEDHAIHIEYGEDQKQTFLRRRMFRTESACGLVLDSFWGEPYGFIRTRNASCVDFTEGESNSDYEPEGDVVGEISREAFDHWIDSGEEFMMLDRLGNPRGMPVDVCRVGEQYVDGNKLGNAFKISRVLDGPLEGDSVVVRQRVFVGKPAGLWFGGRVLLMPRREPFDLLKLSPDMFVAVENDGPMLPIARGA